MYGTEQAYRNETSEMLVKIEQELKKIKELCERVEQQHAEIRKLLSAKEGS